MDAAGKPLHLETVRPKKSTEKKLPIMLRVRDRVVAVAERYGIDYSACEFFSIQGMGGVSVIWVHGLVNIEMVSRGFLAPVYVSPMTMKKWFTGSGKADKDDVLESVLRRFGDHPFEDDNQVEAFCLAQMARYHHLWKTGSAMKFDRYELSVMAKWKSYL